MVKFLKFIFTVSVVISVVGCSNNKFKIAKERVGAITPKTTIQEIDNIFKNDSVVKILSEGAKGDTYFQDDDEYKIYEKGGKHLLTIVPKDQLDSTSTIKSIQIYDSRYKTENGININSTFEQINSKLTINNIETSITSATLFVDELNATMAIDIEELGLKGFNNQKVVKEQIPDLAKIKSLIIWFN